VPDFDQRRKPFPVGAVLTIGALVLAAVAVAALEWVTAPGPQPRADAAGREPLAQIIPGVGIVNPKASGRPAPSAPGLAGEPGPMPREVRPGP
jgi:hypothetical protein